MGEILNWIKFNKKRELLVIEYNIYLYYETHNILLDFLGFFSRYNPILTKTELGFWLKGIIEQELFLLTN